mgnify:CR=1 FL=1
MRKRESESLERGIKVKIKERERERERESFWNEGEETFVSWGTKIPFPCTFKPL